ncbi:MAG: hypothetical protein ACK5MY_02690 [Jhaorihella sp.]
MIKPILMAGVAVAALSVGAQAQTCPDGTLSCNIATVGDKTTTATQNLGDTNDNTYAPDSSSSNSTATNTNDIVSQGGAAEANASGNTSTNNNQSSANNSATNTMSNGDIANNVTGGNIANSGSADITGGAMTQQQQQQQGDLSQSQGSLSQQVGDTAGGTANTQGGTANTRSGNINSAATTNSGKIRNTSSSISQGGAGGSGYGGAGGSGYGGDSASSSKVSGSGNSTVRSAGNSRNTNTQGNTQNTSINNSTRIKEAARTAYAPGLTGYGGQNCVGDTNPSGSFVLGAQSFGWGVSGGRSKASNLCGVMAVGGQRAGAAYLAAQDPYAHKALVAAGVVQTSAMAEARAEANTVSASSSASVSIAGRKTELACPGDLQLVMKSDGKMVCTNKPAASTGGQNLRPAAPTELPSVAIIRGKKVSCPITHYAGYNGEKFTCTKR